MASGLSGLGFRALGFRAEALGLKMKVASFGGMALRLQHAAGSSRALRAWCPLLRIALGFGVFGLRVLGVLCFGWRV